MDAHPMSRHAIPHVRHRVLALALAAGLLAGLPPTALAQIRVHPTGVNVNSQGATTVFLTFGGLTGYQPVEALWCSRLSPAAPDVGLRCDPSTILGSLPVRYDQSTRATGSLTDIMSIPPSVARRAYQAAEFAAVGIDPIDEWVFTDGDGEPIHPHAVYEAFRRIVHNAGIPTIFVNADAIGYQGTELQDAINGDAKALAMFETIRAHGAMRMGATAAQKALAHLGIK